MDSMPTVKTAAAASRGWGSAWSEPSSTLISSAPSSSSAATFRSGSPPFWSRSGRKLIGPGLASSVSGSSSAGFRAVFGRRWRTAVSKRQLAVLVCLALAVWVWVRPTVPGLATAGAWRGLGRDRPRLGARLTEPDDTGPRDPERWLRENSGDRWAISSRTTTTTTAKSRARSRRPRAALISLVRNSELDGIMQSMRQLEYHWNHKYQYPWIFFNDEPFTDEFKAATQNLTAAPCSYETLPAEHWSLPDWIDEGRFMNSLEYLGAIGVGKGWMTSYRHMCRWNSGFFYRHPKLQDFDWYWRVEPDVHFFCDIDYDVFRFMRDNALTYGFNMNILDDARSFPSLWARTRAFIHAHPDLLHPDADLDWLLDAGHGGDYNNCQFFSNFEIGDLRYFRGAANERYFHWLDRGGGFFYERFGDAPIHTLSVAMFVPKRQLWFFRDIGYQHDINRHCPPRSAHRCTCEPTALDENFYRLVPLESPQKKPADTCIRQFLGGDWLRKRDGWTPEAERALGGDGYHGYVLTGLEPDDP
ncbi:MAG: hypothetical protein M1826_000696 [Phylliscum demangeonii]|nr:MAG: hypothetical protein M1826_000696 [Phylliscum demangeonii]